jgi:hypothetical protein
MPRGLNVLPDCEAPPGGGRENGHGCKTPVPHQGFGYPHSRMLGERSGLSWSIGMQTPDRNTLRRQRKPQGPRNSPIFMATGVFRRSCPLFAGRRNLRVRLLARALLQPATYRASTILNAMSTCLNEKPVEKVVPKSQDYLTAERRSWMIFIAGRLSTNMHIDGSVIGMSPAGEENRRTSADAPPWRPKTRGRALARGAAKAQGAHLPH